MFLSPLLARICYIVWIFKVIVCDYLYVSYCLWDVSISRKQMIHKLISMLAGNICQWSAIHGHLQFRHEILVPSSQHGFPLQAFKVGTKRQIQAYLLLWSLHRCVCPSLGCKHMPMTSTCSNIHRQPEHCIHFQLPLCLSMLQPPTHYSSRLAYGIQNGTLGLSYSRRDKLGCQHSVLRSTWQGVNTPTKNHHTPIYTPPADRGGEHLTPLLTMARKLRVPWSQERLEQEQSIALSAVLEAASHASYSSALNSYTDFCSQHNFPLEPTPETLSFYVMYMCHHIQTKSVKSYLSGICNRLQTIYPKVCNSHKHKLVVNTLCGSTKLCAIATSCKRAITCTELAGICIKLNACHLHNDKLFLVILLTGFHGLMRLGELTWPDKLSLHNYRNVTLHHSVTVTNSNYSFLLPFHIADHLFEGNRILIQATNTDDNPFTTFIDYLKSCDTLFSLNPKLWLHTNGTIPTCQWFMQHLKRFISENIGGQSLCASGATAYAEAGVLTHIIQALGQWSSETFRIYIQSHPALLAAIACNQHHE